MQFYVHHFERAKMEKQLISACFCFLYANSYGSVPEISVAAVCFQVAKTTNLQCDCTQNHDRSVIKCLLRQQYGTQTGLLKSFILFDQSAEQIRKWHAHDAPPIRRPFSRITPDDLRFFRELLPGRAIKDPDMLESCNVDWLRTVKGKLKV